MAASTMATENPLAGIGDLTSLVKLFTGSSSSTSTSQAGMQAILQNLISGTQGLSAVTSGSRVAGGYNSSAQSLMTNDFLTRAAAQAAAGSTTTKTAAPISGNSLLTAGAMMTGKSLLGPAVKTGLKKAGISTDNIGGQISDAIFGASTGGADVATSAAWSSGAGLGEDLISTIGASVGGDLIAAGASEALDLGAIAMEGIGDATFDAATMLAEGVDTASFGVPWFTIANLATGGLAGEAVLDIGANIENMFHDLFGGWF